MQEQETTKKELTFEDINPEWSGIIAEQGGFINNRKANFESSDGKSRTIMACNSCVLGEGHGN
jgi:hypothetical protein